MFFEQHLAIAPTEENNRKNTTNEETKKKEGDKEKQEEHKNQKDEIEARRKQIVNDMDNIQVLVRWYYEDAVKRRYLTFIGNLEVPN